MSKDTDLTNFVIPWNLLTEYPPQSDDTVVTYTVRPQKTESMAKDSIAQSSSILIPGLQTTTIKLILEVLTFMFCSISVHIKRINISGRQFEIVKNEACQKGFLIESSAGKTKYLIPTFKAFETFGFDCPYANTEFIEHSFYIGNGCFILKKDSQLTSVRHEVAIGSSGSTSDIVTISKSGIMVGYEITLSTGNLMANAAKYENTAFARIVFLCRDDKTRQAAKAYLRESGLTADLLSRVEYTHFSALLQRQRKLSLY